MQNFACSEIVHQCSVIPEILLQQENPENATQLVYGPVLVVLEVRVKGEHEYPRCYKSVLCCAV